MTTKFTPGPWSIGVPGPNGCPTVGTNQGLMIAMIAHSYNEPEQSSQARANAHLISAAPDLFRLLCEARIALQPEFNYSLINDIDKTIAKALGEQG